MSQFIPGKKKEGEIGQALKEIWAITKLSLDKDIVETWEKLQVEYNSEAFVESQLSKGNDVMMYPAWYFIDKPFLTAIELQMLRQMRQ